MADHTEEFNENEFLSKFGGVPNMPVSLMSEGASHLAGHDGEMPFEALGGQAAPLGPDDDQPETLSIPRDGEDPQPSAEVLAGLQTFDENFTPEMVESYPPMLTTAQMQEAEVLKWKQNQAEDTLAPGQDRAAKMESALRNVAQYDLGREGAAILRDAARLNLSPEELLEAPDFIRKPHLTRDDLIKVSNRYPTVSTLLADPWVMAAFGTPPEVKELGRMEKAYDTLGQTVDRSREAWEYTWMRDERDLLYGQELTYGANADWTARQEHLRQEMEKRLAPQAIALSAEQQRKVAGAVERTESFWQRAWGRPAMASLLGDDYFLPTEAETAAVGDLVNAGLQGGLPEVGARASEVAAGMVHSIAQPETAALALGGAAVGSTVPVIGTAYGAGVGVTAGLARANYYKGLGRGTREALNRGVPMEWARVSGVFTGLMTAFTETAQTVVAAAPVKGAVKSAGDSVFKKYAAEIIKRVALETGLEMTQETLEMVSQDMSTALSNKFSGTELAFNSFQDYVDRNWETFKFMALGGSWVAAAGPMTSLPRDVISIRRARRAETVQALAQNLAAETLVKEISAAARNSEAMRAAPEAAGALIERIAQDKNGPQTVFIEAEVLETYRQSAFENDGLDWSDFEDGFLEPMGISAEQYRNALDEGVSLELPLSGIPAVAGTPVWQAIEQSEGMIRAEPAKVTGEKIEAANTIEDPFADVSLVPAVTDETRVDLERRLMDEAGRPKEQAKAGAEILARGVSRLLGPLGLDPNTWLAEKLSFSQVNADRTGAVRNQAAHIPADDPRVVFRSGMKDLANIELVTALGVGGAVNYGQARESAKQFSQQVVENIDLGEGIRITNSGINETMRHRPGQADLRAFEVLPEMLTKAQWVRKDPNARESGRVSEVLFLYAPVEVDGQLYAAQITTKRGEGGELHYYGHALKQVEGNPATWSGEAASGDTTSGSAMSSPLSFKLIDLLENVKSRGSRLPGDLRSLFQDNDGPGPRGWLDIMADKGLRLNFTEAADASTVIHEGGHLFVELAKEVLSASPDQVADWEAFSQLNEEFRALAEWAGQDDPYGQWSTEAHEKAARGLEAYLMEGRAPVPGLRKLFERVKAWMIDIYRSLRNLNAPLTPEARDFFDRLMASDMELALDGWRIAEPEGLAPEVLAELAGPRQEARQAMEEAIRQKRVGEVERMRRQWRKEGAEEADLDPHQQMLADIIQAGGLSLSSLKAGQYSDQDIALLNRKRPGLVSSKSRVGFDEFAERFGYEGDSDAFIQSLRNAPSRAELIDRYVAAQEDFYADYLAEDAPITEAEINLLMLEAEAIRLKDNAEEAVRVLRETRKALKKEGGASRLKRAIHESTGLKTVNELVRKNMADLKASLKAEARAAQGGERAGLEKGKAIGYKRGVLEGYRVGSRDGAAAKRLELGLKYKAEKEAKADIQKTRAKWTRFVRQKPGSPTAIREGGIDPEFSIQAKQLLNQLGFNIRPRGQNEIKGAPSLAMFVADQQAQGNDIYAADWILNDQWPLDSKGRPKTIGRLSYDQFVEVKNTVDSLLYVGRQNQNLLAGANRQTFDQASEVIINGLTAHVPKRPEQGPGPRSRAVELAGKYEASLAKGEYVIREMDGYEMMGPVWEVLYKPIKKASDDKIVLGEKMLAGLKEAWQEFTPQDRRAMSTSPGREQLTKLAERTWLPVPDSWRTTRRTFQGAPHSLTEAEIVATFANMGNPYNLERLLLGNKFTVESLAEIADYVMARPKLHQAAVKMLECINELYAPLAETHFKATGAKLAKVDPGEITLPNGVKAQGWYYPVAYDPDQSNMAFQQGQADTAMNHLAAMGYGRRSARSGSSHERVGAIAPLSLSLDVVNQHIQDTVHDITHRLAVRDVQRLLNRDDVRQAILDHLGRDREQALQQWINWVAKPKNADVMPLLSGLDWLRRNIVTATLAFNFSTPIMQYMGLTQTADLIGFKATYNGLKTLAQNPAQVSQFIRDNSPEVRARDQGFDQDMQEIIKVIGDQSGILSGVRDGAIKAGFWAIKVNDRIVAYATWQGAYDKAIEEGRTIEWAREYADTAVRMTQPLASPKDTAAIQRHPAGKLFGMYYTFFSGFQNRLTERFRGVFVTKKLNPVDLMSTVLWTITLPSVLAYIYHHEDIPDEPEDFKNLLVEMAVYSTTGIPVARDLVSGMLSDYPYQMSPVSQVGQSLERLVKSKAPEAKAKNAVRSAGYLFGLPTNQALKTWDGMWKMVDDDTSNPIRLFKPEPRDKD